MVETCDRRATHRFAPATRAAQKELSSGYKYRSIRGKESSEPPSGRGIAFNTELVVCHFLKAHQLPAHDPGTAVIVIFRSAMPMHRVCNLSGWQVCRPRLSWRLPAVNAPQPRLPPAYVHSARKRRTPGFGGFRWPEPLHHTMGGEWQPSRVPREQQLLPGHVGGGLR
jgi:hypothetical protein